MLGGLGNLTGMLKQAREMKDRLEQVQVQAANMRFSGEAGGGAVTAVVDGRGSVVDVKISPEATSDVELLEDMVKAAFALAIKRSQEGMKEEMAKVTGGIQIPGLTDMLGGSQT